MAHQSRFCICSVREFPECQNWVEAAAAAALFFQIVREKKKTKKKVTLGSLGLLGCFSSKRQKFIFFLDFCCFTQFYYCLKGDVTNARTLPQSSICWEKWARWPKWQRQAFFFAAGMPDSLQVKKRQNIIFPYSRASIGGNWEIYENYPKNLIQVIFGVNIQMDRFSPSKLYCLAKLSKGHLANWCHH